MKAYCASLIHETNRGSPIPTSLENFREDFLYLPSTGEGESYRGGMLDGVDWAVLAEPRGIEVAWGLLAGAEPSAAADQATYELLRGELLDGLKQALPVDAVALFLHGAQIAEGEDDVTGDILRHVRQIVGPDVPVGVVLDLHGNVSQTTLDHIDVALGCLEYPHFDQQDRAGQLLDLLKQSVTTGLRFQTLRERVPMIGTYHTTRQPMRGLVDRALSQEGQKGIAAVSLMHGFFDADTPHCGACVLVCAERGSASAPALAKDMARRWFAIREDIRSPHLSPQEAIRRALASPEAPIVIGDTSDNPGSGNAGDNTAMLAALLLHAQSGPSMALGMMWDPLAADFAARAGKGASLRIRLGGKAGVQSGDPIDLIVKVLAVRSDVTQMVQGRPYPLGLAAVLSCGNLTIVVNSIRQQVFDPNCFEGMGVSLADQKLVVVKSMQHFQERFAPLAGGILYAEAAADSCDTFRKIPRPMWPLDTPPFTAFDSDWT